MVNTFNSKKFTPDVLHTKLKIHFTVSDTVNWCMVANTVI